LILYQT